MSTSSKASRKNTGNRPPLDSQRCSKRLPVIPAAHKAACGLRFGVAECDVDGSGVAVEEGGGCGGDGEEDARQVPQVVLCDAGGVAVLLVVAR